jgi:hypothetical protein
LFKFQRKAEIKMLYVKASVPAWPVLIFYFI